VRRDLEYVKWRVRWRQRWEDYRVGGRSSLKEGIFGEFVQNHPHVVHRWELVPGERRHPRVLGSGDFISLPITHIISNSVYKFPTQEEKLT